MRVSSEGKAWLRRAARCVSESFGGSSSFSGKGHLGRTMSWPENRQGPLTEWFGAFPRSLTHAYDSDASHDREGVVSREKDYISRSTH